MWKCGNVEMWKCGNVEMKGKEEKKGIKFFGAIDLSNFHIFTFPHFHIYLCAINGNPCSSSALFFSSPARSFV